MGKPIDVRQVEYAYEAQSAIVPNVEVDGGYAARITISYELKDADGVTLGYKAIEHYSAVNEDKRTATEVTAWVTDSRDDLISADKFNLAGYGA